MTNQLEQLKQYTTVVADTGDFNLMKEFAPQEATTNPSLILQASGKPEYAHLLEQAVRELAGSPLSGRTRVCAIMDRLLVLFGTEILGIVPGRVSTEVDARLSFDTEGTLARAANLIALYEQQGIPRERVLIKIAATWEGIRAARILERDGIQCNLTLLFSLVQAVACAEAGVRLISPFVGRICDWYKEHTGRDYAPAEDPGVLSVKTIYNYYKKFGYGVQIMGASFRSAGQIRELAGCDLLTISSKLLEELARSAEPLERKLDPAGAMESGIERFAIDEKSFRFLLNEDTMATEKTAEGIRRFSADIRQLEQMIEVLDGGR